MDISSYLSELIQTRKAVGIIGLGTVLKTKTPGKYDAGTHSFIPPSYHLDFSTEVKEEVSLAEFIGKKRNVSVDTAIYFINEFTATVLDQLNNCQDVILSGIGKLSKTDHEFRFTPAEESNYGFDFYGLPPVKEEQESPIEEIIAETPEVEPAVETVAETSSEPITPAEEKPVSLQSVVVENEREEENPGGDQAEKLQEEIESLNFYRSKLPYLKNTTPEAEEIALKLNDPRDDQELTRIRPTLENRFIDPATPFTPPAAPESKTFPAYVKVILGLVIVILMLSIAYFVKPEWFAGITGYHPPVTQKAVQPFAPLPEETLPAADTVIVKDSTQQNKSAPVIKDTIVNTNKIAVQAAADTATVYEVIGASMHDQKEADNFIAQMKRSGVTAKVATNMSGKRLKISLATLNDEKSARLELDRLSKKLKIPGIYIYRTKQK